MAPTAPIKILEGIRQGKIGGGESYLLSLVENLDRSQFEPVVVSFTDGPMITRLRELGIATHIIPTETPFDVRVWKKVQRLINDEKISLVHAHGTRAASNLFWAAKKAALPFIYTCHAWSFHPDQNKLVKAIRIKSEAFLTRQADVTICGAEANRTTGRKLFPNFDAVIIRNAIDAKRFNPHGAYKNLRAELGLPADHLVVASIARFTLQKQPLQLIKAFAAVAAKLPHVTLLLVGDGEQKEAAEKLIQQLNLTNRVVLQPFRHDIPDVLAAVDIFVLPSLWEAFPIALLEAMSMGKAVIGTQVDGTPEMITHNENGLLIDVAQLQSQLEEALLRLCTDAELRHRLQVAAIKSIYNRYNVETLARENEAVYKKLLPRFFKSPYPAAAHLDNR